MLGRRCGDGNTVEVSGGRVWKGEWETEGDICEAKGGDRSHQVDYLVHRLDGVPQAQIDAWMGKA